MITIIDYDAGNLRSVEKALQSLGCKTEVTSDKSKILSADKVILPGVGAFKDAMDKLRKYELTDVIKSVIEKNTPFLGICLGMQLMYEKSEEGNAEGLGILKGRVLKFPDNMGLKIPQIGWNSLEIKKPSRLFCNISDNSFVYFVHSYYVEAEDISTVSATVDYGVKPHVSVEKNNLFLTQFHPEKSGETGLMMLKNFAEI